MGEAKGLIITGIITVSILIGGVMLLSKGGNSNTRVLANPDLLIRENSHQTTKGAKVTIVEFGDYQCPACGQAHPIVKEVIKNYADKINFVFRNYPLSQHKNAQIAAQAAEAANVQGKFWEMHDKLYDTQKDWEESSKPLDMFLTYAKDLGLDVNKFKSDVEGQKFTTEIGQDMNDGNNLSVNATPTFYINGQVLPGVPSYSDFKAIIDPLLAN